MVKMVKLSEISVGKTFEFKYGPVTREMIINYGNASGDKNPIHMNDDFAVNVAKLGGVIAHGMLSYGILIKHLSDVMGDGKLITISGEMRGMVRPGDDYILTYKVKAIDGNKVTFEIIEDSFTPIKLEKDGQLVKKFEADEKGWVTEKDVEKGLVKTKDTPEGTLTYMQRLAIPAEAIVELN
jgi:acyl dehydratase